MAGCLVLPRSRSSSSSILLSLSSSVVFAVGAAVLSGARGVKGQESPTPSPSPSPSEEMASGLPPLWADGFIVLFAMGAFAIMFMCVRCAGYDPLDVCRPKKYPAPTTVKSTVASVRRSVQARVGKGQSSASERALARLQEQYDEDDFDDDDDMVVDDLDDTGV